MSEPLHPSTRNSRRNDPNFIPEITHDTAPENLNRPWRVDPNVDWSVVINSFLGAPVHYAGVTPSQSDPRVTTVRHTLGTNVARIQTNTDEEFSVRIMGGRHTDNENTRHDTARSGDIIRFSYVPDNSDNRIVGRYLGRPEIEPRVMTREQVGDRLHHSGIAWVNVDAPISAGEYVYSGSSWGAAITHRSRGEYEHTWNKLKNDIQRIKDKKVQKMLNKSKRRKKNGR